MLRYGLSTLALFAVLTISANVQAGAIGSLINGQNQLQDTDYESLLDSNGTPTTIDDGDVFIGVFSIDTVNGTPNFLAPGGPAAFTGIIAAAVDSFDSSTGVITFRALDATEYSALQTQFPSLPGRANVDSALLIYDKNAVFPPATTNGYLQPNAGIDTAIMSASTGVNGIAKIMELGFTGSTYAASQLNGPDISQGFKFRLALNVTDPPSAFSVQTITSAQSGIKELDGSTNLPVTSVHISGNTNTDSSGSFQFQTDAVLKFNATVPEPGSMTLFGLGALGLLGARLRRRNAA